MLSIYQIHSYTSYTTEQTAYIGENPQSKTIFNLRKSFLPIEKTKLWESVLGLRTLPNSTICAWFYNSTRAQSHKKNTSRTHTKSRQIITSPVVSLVYNVTPLTEKNQGWEIQNYSRLDHLGKNRSKSKMFAFSFTRTNKSWEFFLLIRSPSPCLFSDEISLPSNKF